MGSPLYTTLKSLLCLDLHSDLNIISIQLVSFNYFYELRSNFVTLYYCSLLSFICLEKGEISCILPIAEHIHHFEKKYIYIYLCNTYIHLCDILEKLFHSILQHFVVELNLWGNTKGIVPYPILYSCIQE